MKPFNLERALAGDKVVTRDGREVTQLTKFDCEGECLAGVLDLSLSTWNKNGQFWGTSEESDDDLFMAPKTVKHWVNFYSNETVVSFDSEESAKEVNYRHLKPIAIAVPVEFEEGYGCEVQP